MTGWNMPPGANVSDIPGNRPEDLLDEWLWERGEDFRDGYGAAYMGATPRRFSARLLDGWYAGLVAVANDIWLEEYLLEAEEARERDALRDL